MSEDSTNIAKLLREIIKIGSKRRQSEKDKERLQEIITALEEAKAKISEEQVLLQQKLNELQ